MELEPVGKNEYELFFGPAHPGSGNFSVKLKLDGERVISARADPGYLPVSYTHLTLPTKA